MSLGLQDILNSHRNGQDVLMGVLNVTPDSFSDGGKFNSPRAALQRVEQMLLEGADIIDIGAESTRPGARRMDVDEQKRRLEEILPAAIEAGALVSIDTTRSQVASWALDAGCAILNDISAGRDDPDMLPLAARRNVPIILMHMQGTPATMQSHPSYNDVVSEVREFLARRLEAADQAGLPRSHCIVDPGIGFGKRLEHNLALLRNLDRLTELDVPILIGPSRKRFISDIAGPAEPDQRLGGTLASCLAARQRGASIFRVHDVGPLAQALKVARAIQAGPGKA